MAEEANGSCVYYYDREEDKDVIYIAKQIKDALTMEPLGILRASIKVDYLEKMAASARAVSYTHLIRMRLSGDTGW